LQNGAPQLVPQQTAPFAAKRLGVWGSAAAAAILLISGGAALLQRNVQQATLASSERSALVTEVSDHHIATLAANSPLEVLSSDKHTVKPWFQGKLPFSFNLPDKLPPDTTLDGANLTYLRSQPVCPSSVQHWPASRLGLYYGTKRNTPV
jgi:anti-sigma factor RsiW